MSSASMQNLFPVQRLGFRQTGVVAAVTAAVQTGVVAFANEPVACNPASLNPLTTWVRANTVALSANEGTHYKFTQRGIYEARLYAPGVAASTGANMFAISLDWTGANLLAATTPTPANGCLDLAWNDDVADQFGCWKLNCKLFITDTLSGGAGPVAGVGGTGVMRVHANTGAGAVPTAAEIVLADVTLWVDYLGDAAG